MMEGSTSLCGRLALTGSEQVAGRLQSKFQLVNDTSVQAVIEILKQTLPTLAFISENEPNIAKILPPNGQWP